MMSLFVAACAVPWTIVAVAAEAKAQGAVSRRIGAGLYAGGSFPLGHFRDDAKLGYHIGGSVKADVNRLLDITIDVAFNKLSDKPFANGSVSGEVGTNVIFATAGAQLDLVAPSRSSSGGNAISPFLLAGVGAYRFRFDIVCTGVGCAGPAREDRNETHWGLNIGAGAALPFSKVQTFVQVVYHTVFSSTSQSENTPLILASIGLRF